MDNVRLEVRETSRNSEKPRPKARIPPKLNKKTKCKRVNGSVSRNNLSEVLRLNPTNTHNNDKELLNMSMQCS